MTDTFPVWNPGQDITADALNMMLPQTYWKAVSEDRVSTTTLADDADLVAPLLANAVYHVTMYLHYAATNACRLKTQWRVPSGVTGNRSCLGADQGQILSVTSGGQGRFGVHLYSTPSTYGTRDSSSNQCFAIEDAIVTTGSTAGTLALQWAQATSGVDITRMGAGSYMEVKRLA
jgi:hypothetical protein